VDACPDVSGASEAGCPPRAPDDAKGDEGDEEDDDDAGRTK